MRPSEIKKEFQNPKPGPLLRLHDKCVTADSIQLEKKYLATCKKLITKCQSKYETLEKNNNSVKALQDLLEQTQTFLKSNENHLKMLEKKIEQHKNFYPEYARSLVQHNKNNSYNVKRGKQALLTKKPAWQYGTTNKKRKKN